MTLEKTEISGLYKDSETGAVINKDKTALTAYKAKKQQSRLLKSLNSRVKILEDRIEYLESVINNSNNINE